MILDGGVAVCLLLSAHRTVIFAIAQLSCMITDNSAVHIYTHLIIITKQSPLVNTRAPIINMLLQRSYTLAYTV